MSEHTIEINVNLAFLNYGFLYVHMLYYLTLVWESLRSGLLLFFNLRRVFILFKY